MTLLDISPELRRPVVSYLALLLPRLPSPRTGPSYLLSAGTIHQVFGPCDVAAKVAMVDNVDASGLVCVSSKINPAFRRQYLGGTY